MCDVLHFLLSYSTTYFTATTTTFTTFTIRNDVKFRLLRVSTANQLDHSMWVCWRLTRHRPSFIQSAGEISALLWCTIEVNARYNLAVFNFCVCCFSPSDSSAPTSTTTCKTAAWSTLPNKAKLNIPGGARRESSRKSMSAPAAGPPRRRRGGQRATGFIGGLESRLVMRGERGGKEGWRDGAMEGRTEGKPETCA